MFTVPFRIDRQMLEAVGASSRTFRNRSRNADLVPAVYWSNNSGVSAPMVKPQFGFANGIRQLGSTSIFIAFEENEDNNQWSGLRIFPSSDLNMVLEWATLYTR